MRCLHMTGQHADTAVRFLVAAGYLAVVSCPCECRRGHIVTAYRPLGIFRSLATFRQPTEIFQRVPSLTLVEAASVVGVN